MNKWDFPPNNQQILQRQVSNALEAFTHNPTIENAYACGWACVAQQEWRREAFTVRGYCRA